MSIPRVSVLLPIFNSRRYVDSTISSLLAQTLTDWECVVSDHSSTDGSLEYLTRAVGHDPRFVFLEPQARSAVGVNWNHALGHARGDFVKLLCADDILYPNCLTDQADAFDSSSELVFVGGHRDVIRADGCRVRRSGAKESGTATRISPSALRHFARTGSNPLHEPSFVMFRTSALVDVGGFAEDWSYLIDVMTYLRILEYGEGLVVDSTVGAFRLHAGSWSTALKHEQPRETRRSIRELASHEAVGATSWDRAAGLVAPQVTCRLRPVFTRAAEFYPGSLPKPGWEDRAWSP